MATWTTPKTNWTSSDNFSYVDYNRIKNNLTYINDKLNEDYPEKAVIIDLGEDYTYNKNYYPSKFNAFEETLESFTRIGVDINIGEKKTFTGNGVFIDYNELNRIEKCCLKWYNYSPAFSAITISPTTAILNVGDSCTFTVSCTPQNLEGKEDYTVECSDESVVEITKDGMSITAIAVGNGMATITVGIDEVSATATIQADLIQVTKITPSVKSVTVNKSESKIIDLTFYPEDAINATDWSVTTNNDNVSVMKLNNNQIKITGNNAGSTSIITITCGDISTTIGVEIPQGINDLWVSNVKPNTKYASNIEAHCPRISIQSVPVGGKKYTQLYVVADPMSSYNPQVEGYNVSFSDPSICRNDKMGTNEVINLLGLKKGQTIMTISVKGLSWDVKLYVG